MKLSKVKIVLFFIAAVTLAAGAAAFGVGALGNSKEIVNPKPLDNPSMIRDEYAPALASLAALYAPANTKDDWLKLVCMGMTEGGCAYFKSNQADALWQSQAGHAADSVGGHISDETVINDTAQVWQAEVTIFANSKQSTTSDVFILVERGGDGNWYLNRVLTGPGISDSSEQG